jgi:hypothetical protein
MEYSFRMLACKAAIKTSLKLKVLYKHSFALILASYPAVFGCSATSAVLQAVDFVALRPEHGRAFQLPGQGD